MKPNDLAPVFAINLGYDINGLNDDDKVTIVRRRVIYEEKVISKSEFHQINELIDCNEEFYLSDVEMKDIQFPCFTDEQTEYIAFPGDVTSFTDDAISFFFEHKEWTSAYESIKLAF